jgi:hypothetical protein
VGALARAFVGVGQLEVAHRDAAESWDSEVEDRCVEPREGGRGVAERPEDESSDEVLDDSFYRVGGGGDPLP